MVKKFWLIIRTSPLVQFTLGLQRSFRSNNKYSKKKYKKSRFNINFPALPISVNLAAMIVMLMLVLFTFAHVYQYLLLQPKPLHALNLSNGRVAGKEQNFNVILYGLDTEERGGESYKYINLVNLVSIRQNKTIIFAINPYFNISTSSNSPIKSYLNQTEESTEVDIMHELTEQIEDITGISIDRYIVVEVSDFADFIGSYGYSLNEDSRESLSVKRTDEVDKPREQSIIIKNAFEKIFTDFGLYRMFWSSNYLSDVFRTDMQKDEILFFAQGLRRTKNFVTGFISIESSNNSLETVQELAVLTPNRILIDEQVVRLFREINLISEQAEIELYNGTEIPGLAGKRQREFQNLGANIVKYGNHHELLEKSTLYIEDESDLDKYKSTINMIRRSLNNQLDIAIGQYVYNKTGDIILVLGQNGRTF